jgi:predicted NBD/HSP70 family sugar kinase
LMWNQRFNLPVYIENEANAGALGEYYFGAAREVNHFIYLSAGVGLGGGIMMDGKLFRGANGYASEIGHVTLDPQGELCGCGKRGCWETLVGPRAVVQRVQHVLSSGGPSTMASQNGGDLSLLTFEGIVEAAQSGDPVALTALQEVGRNLGIGIANLVNIFNPELIVFGGVLNLASSILLPILDAVVCDNALQLSCQGLRIAASAHGIDACVMGAIALVLDDILREPLYVG